MKQSLLSILFSLFAVFGCSAQHVSTEDSNNKEPVRAPTDCGISYKEWVKKDVAYIISSKEKKEFNALKTDEERENFIGNFWRRRDPNPDTEENEYREEYYERIKYANEQFAWKIPGWMTDRGRVYISWGKPDKVEKGYGAFEESVNPVPYEKWFYEHLAGVGNGVVVTFIDPTETGEFRYEKLPETKLDLVEGRSL